MRLLSTLFFIHCCHLGSQMNGLFFQRYARLDGDTQAVTAGGHQTTAKVLKKPRKAVRQLIPGQTLPPSIVMLIIGFCQV